ncbi:MAG: hypothetical protein ACP5H8_00380, partial [Candidatus Micrarchaeia archaeon]
MAKRKPKLAKKKMTKRKVQKAAPPAPKLTTEEKKIVERIEPVIEKDVEKEIVEKLEEVEEDNLMKIAVSVVVSTLLAGILGAAIFYFNPLPTSQLALVTFVMWVILMIVTYFFQS